MKEVKVYSGLRKIIVPPVSLLLLSPFRPPKEEMDCFYLFYIFRRTPKTTIKCILTLHCTLRKSLKGRQGFRYIYRLGIVYLFHMKISIFHLPLLYHLQCVKYAFLVHIYNQNFASLRLQNHKQKMLRANKNSG